MAVTAFPQITALEAEAKASLFLSDNLPDRFTAGDPALDSSADHWRVPVLLSYPNIGPVGQVGDIVIDAGTEQILSHTATEEMLARARALYDEHQDAIEAAFS
ncbi:MAG TPA: hypothetical protein VN687_16010 [Blastocatellia bacterium]|nr:hypothetical protein [Blastocatellia bacterium]